MKVFYAIDEKNIIKIISCNKQRTEKALRIEENDRLILKEGIAVSSGERYEDSLSRFVLLADCGVVKNKTIIPIEFTLLKNEEKIHIKEHIKSMENSFFIADVLSKLDEQEQLLLHRHFKNKF